MKIKLLVICLSVLVLAPAGARAQGRGSDGPGGGDRPGGGQQQGPRAGLRPLVRFLELDDSQLEALVMMQRDNAQALRSLVQSAQENGLALREALAADPPDEATVGRLVLAGRAIQREVNMLRNSQLEAAPDALNLSPEQREKLEVLQISLRVAPIAQMAARLNLVRDGRIGAVLGTAPPLGPRPSGGDRGPNRGGEGGGEMQGLTPAELEMTLESLQSEVDRIGQNVDRVSQRLSVPPIPREQ